jgi:hypothetical protein
MEARPAGLSDMKHAWYVTFEIPRSGTLVRQRRSRSTLTFETEDEAKNFARTKFNEGLIVTAGTIIPHLPRRAFASDRIPSWLEEGQHADPNEQETSEQDKTGGSQP